MGTVILIILLFAVAIGLMAWSKSKLLSQGKIIQRSNDFMEYAEILL